jgi:hypothetical protein
MTRHREPRDFFYYTDREAAEEHQQTKFENDADSVRKGDQ